ncbi:MAG: carbohydrate-binding domain-containing protein [Ruminococcus sp.]
MCINKKFRGFLGAAVAFSLFTAGCSANSPEDSGSVSGTESVVNDADDSSTSQEKITALSDEASSYQSNVSEVFSDCDLNADYDELTADISLTGSSAEINGKGAELDDSDIVISEGGVYRLSGTLDNGQIIVDSVEKVQLILDNAEISCKDSSPVYIKNADKTFITLADGSENTLTDGSDYKYENESDNEPDAAIFSHDSLTINGSGSLTVNASYNEGITSKDDIVITGGRISVKSTGNGIKGKNYVAVCNAVLDIDAGGDGIKSTNISETGFGFVYIQSGELNITAQEDGIQADSEFIGEGGTFSITSGGGAESAEPKANNDFMHGNPFNNSFTEDTEENSVSTKGIKGGTAVYISNGSFNINSSDDCLHSNGNLTVSDGEITLSAGSKAIHSDSSALFSGGNITVEACYEGIEAAVINVTDGDISITASDDGFNASSGSGGRMPGENNSDTSIELNISGGNVYVDADGDGLDSNGTLNINGGTVLVNGPTNEGNGALDSESGICANGGLLIAAGSSGMAETPDSQSEQHSVAVGFENTLDSGTLVTLCDNSGNEIISFAPAKKFSHIIISSPDIKDGETYTIYTGGSSDAEEEHGLYSSGGYQNDGTELDSFTADDMTSLIGTQGMMGGGFGGGNFRPHNGNMEIPTNESGEPEMPEDFVGKGGKRPDFEMTTDENGEPVMPERDGSMPVPPDFNRDMEPELS